MPPKRVPRGSFGVSPKKKRVNGAPARKPPQKSSPTGSVYEENGHGTPNGQPYDGVPSLDYGISYTQPGKRRSTWTRMLSCLVVLSYLAGIVLSVLVMLGCISTTAGINNLYLAELRTNDTYDIRLQVGYFGGCLSVANLASSTQSNTTSVVSSFSTSVFHTPVFHCVTNMRSGDLDDVSEWLREDLNLINNTQDLVKASLNATLPQASHLQNDIFFWQPPVLQLTTFFISGLMLFVALMGASHQRRYKAVLLLASLLGAFALALALLMVMGSLQALNAIVNGGRSNGGLVLSSGVYLQRADWLEWFQVALAVVTAIFLTIMGILFVRRRPEGFGNIWLQIGGLLRAPVKG